MCVCRWKELVKITEERKELLAGASKVHKFIREADDTKDRISDKVRTVTPCWWQIQNIYVLSIYRVKLLLVMNLGRILLVWKHCLENMKNWRET